MPRRSRRVAKHAGHLGGAVEALAAPVRSSGAASQAGPIHRWQPGTQGIADLAATDALAEADDPAVLRIGCHRRWGSCWSRERLTEVRQLRRRGKVIAIDDRQPGLTQ